MEYIATQGSDQGSGRAQELFYRRNKDRENG